MPSQQVGVRVSPRSFGAEERTRRRVVETARTAVNRVIVQVAREETPFGWFASSPSTQTPHGMLLSMMKLVTTTRFGRRIRA